MEATCDPCLLIGQSVRSHRFRTKSDLILTAVGAGISGCLYGWTPILLSGVGVACVCTVGIGTYYLASMFSVLELTMSSGIKTDGASFQFVAPLLGEEWGVLASYAELCKLIANSALGVISLAAYICSAFESQANMIQVGPGWALVTFLYAIAASRGSVSHTSQLVTTWMSLSVISVFCVCAIPVANIGEEKLLSFTLSNSITTIEERISSALLFSVWFYMGCESIVLSASQTMQPKQLLPPSATMALLILVVASLSVIIATVSLLPLEDIITDNTTPLYAGFKAQKFLPSVAVSILSLFVAASLWPSLNGYIFYSCSFLAQVGEAEGVPFFVQRPLVATVTSTSILLYGLSFFLQFNPTSVLNTILWLALAGGICQYAFQFAAYLAFARQEFNKDHQTSMISQQDQDEEKIQVEGDVDELDDIWRSPLGSVGAIFGLCMSAILGFALIILAVESPIYRPGALVFIFAFLCALIHATFFLPVRKVSNTPSSSRILPTSSCTMEKKDDEKPSASTPLLRPTSTPSSSYTLWSFVGSFHR